MTPNAPWAARNRETDRPAGQTARHGAAQRAPRRAEDAAAAGGPHAAAGRRARRCGACGEVVQPVRQSRQPRSVLDLHRSASRPGDDLRRRGRRRSLGAGARRRCIAGCITCSAERCRRCPASGPEDLNVAPLLARIAEGGVSEVILALGATVDGATTAHWLTDRLRPLGVAVTRVGAGRADRRRARRAGRRHARRGVARTTAVMRAGSRPAAFELDGRAFARNPT